MYFFIGKYFQDIFLILTAPSTFPRSEEYMPYNKSIKEKFSGLSNPRLILVCRPRTMRSPRNHSKPHCLQSPNLPKKDLKCLDRPLPTFQIGYSEQQMALGSPTPSYELDPCPALTLFAFLLIACFITGSFH
jgi:hypothetical protein